MDNDWTAIAHGLGYIGPLTGISTNVPAEFLAFLKLHLEKYVELQKTHSESILRAAQAEQQARRLDEQIAISDARSLALKTELDSLTSLHEKVSVSLKQLQAERGQLLSTLEEARLNDERLKNRLMTVESENSELVRANDRKLAEKASLEADHERLLALMAKIRHDTSEAEERLLEAQRDRSRLSFELSRAQGDIEQLREKLSWSESELERALNEVAEYRKQKSQEITELNGMLNEKTDELNQLTIRVGQLAKDNEAANKSLRDCHEELSALKSELNKAKSDFEAEMESKSRLADLYKHSLEDTEKHVKEMEESLENASNRIAELESSIQQGKEMESNKRHVADVFAENSNARLELLRLKQENEKLKECLEDVCGEIEARAPLLNQERKENERLKRELLALTTQVVELGKARDELASAQSNSWLEVERLRRENHALNAQSQDLSGQLRLLIRKLESSDHDSSPSAFADALDENSVVFRSVEELQSRNAELIRRVHELEYSLSQAGSNSVDRQKLESALKEIEELNNTRSRQSAMLESLLKQQPNSSLSHRLSSSSLLEPSISKEIESLKSEKMRIEQTLRDQIQALLSAEGDLRAKLSMAESQAQYANESLEAMRRSLEAERAELSQLRIRCRELADINMKLNGQVQAASLEAMSAKEREHQSSIALGRIQSELQSVKSAEERGAKELVDLRSERDRYVRLIAQLQAAISDNEAGFKEVRERLTQQIELLEKELTSVRQRLAAELEETRNSYLTVERERRELMSKQEQLLDQLTSAKSELIRLQAENTSSAAMGHSLVDDASLEHYKASAKASEQALAELGKSFEEYRSRVESEGFSQYEHLVKELESTRAEMQDQQLKHQLESSELHSRLRILEQIEQQLREHGNMRLEDLANIQNELLRVQEELSMERQQYSASQAELAKLTDEIEKHQHEESTLRNKVAELESHIAKFDEEKISLTQEHINLQQRFDELSSNYDGLLEKLEGSLKPSYLFSGSVDTESDQIQQVIRYLRREKDALEKEKSALESENRRLTNLYDQVSKSYAQLKRSLTSTVGEDASANQRVVAEITELRQRLEQLGGYRETAAVLQAQVDSLTERLAQTEADLRASVEKLAPLKESNRELKASVAAHKHEVKILSDDRDMWKRRCQDSHQDGAEYIDQTEVEQMRSDLEQLRQEKEQITIEANQKLSLLETRCTKAIERFTHYKKRSEELQHKINELEAQLQQQSSHVSEHDHSQQVPNEQMADIANDLEETRGLLNEALAQKDDLQEKLTQTEQKCNRLAVLLQKQKTVKRDYDALKGECERGMQEAKDVVAQLESKFTDLTKEQNLHQTVLISQWKSRFEKLSSLLEEYKARFGDMQSAVVPQSSSAVPPAKDIPVKRELLDKDDPASPTSPKEANGPEKSARLENDVLTDSSYNGEEDTFEGHYSNTDDDGENGHDVHNDDHDSHEDNDDDSGDSEEDDDNDGYEEEEHEMSDDPMMSDDDLMPVFPASIMAANDASNDSLSLVSQPTVSVPVPSEPAAKKTDLFATMKALSPSNDDVKPRPRFVDLSGIRSSSSTVTAPLTPQPSQQPNKSKSEQGTGKKRGNRTRGSRRRNQ